MFLFDLVDGGYSEWEEWSDCSVTCGGGTRTRYRQCTNPVPQHGGKDCEDLEPPTETEECNSNECPGKYFCFSLFTRCWFVVAAAAAAVVS